MVGPGTTWDDLISADLQQFSDEVVAHLTQEGDPAHGQWSVDPDDVCVVSSDASEIGLGVVLEVSGIVIEDRSWLRPHGDK